MRMLCLSDPPAESEPRPSGRGFAGPAGRGPAVRTRPTHVERTAVRVPVVRDAPRLSGRGALAVGSLVALLAGAADAQVPPRGSWRDVPLPGPAPSAVVARPPLALPAAPGGPAAAPPVDPWAPLPAGAPAAAPLPAAGPASLWDALREAEAELARREEDLTRCRTRLADVNGDLARTRDHLARLENGMSALRVEVLDRMVLLDRIGRGGTARIVLTSHDPAEARFRASLVRRLVRADAELASRYEAMRDEAEAVRAELTVKLGSQRALERQLEDRRRQLSDEVDRHRRLLSSLETPAGLASLARGSHDELAGLVAAFAFAPATAEPGTLGPLAAAAVAVPASFPTRADALRGGLALDLPAGLPIAAPSAGVVAYAGELDGYGTAVLIRTADGRGLLLGHLASVTVAPGDPVAAGDLLGASAPSYSPLLPSLLLGVLDPAIRES
ncbi:MAG: peptidoglycan DD-metalloendopeptidase family protein [Deltaproteobacteria bacterium]|nr:peptidoglycan DD-metalloendopeptidase family protein [Deltaproteobacteria bacterium]